MTSKGIVLIGGFAHESNTFSPLQMDADEFWMHQGDFSALELENNEYSGALPELRRRGYTPYPVVATGATVGGTIEHRLLDRYMKCLFTVLDNVQSEQVVGLQWVLHGSSTVEGVADIQTHILQSLRERFPEVPLVVSMDLHSTITAALLQLVDGLVHYRTAPHIDMQDTGIQAARMLDLLITSGLETERVAIKLPFLLPGEYGQTGSAVMREIYSRIWEFAVSTEALDVSLSQGFPWADNPDGVVTLLGIWPLGGVDATVRDGIYRMARHIWKCRQDIYDSLSLHAPREVGDPPPPGYRYMVFCDSGDNPTAGAPEDRVGILADVLGRGSRGILFLPIVDADFVELCGKARAGDMVLGSLGGLLSNTSSVEVEARIMRTGDHNRVGKWAVVDIRGNIVVITERRFGVSTPQILVDCGFSLDALPRTIVVKSGYLFAPWKTFLKQYRGLELLLSTEGSTSLDLGTFSYHCMPLNSFPLSHHETGHWNMIEFSAKGRYSFSQAIISLA